MPSLKQQISICARLQLALSIAAVVGAGCFYLLLYRPFTVRLANAKRATVTARAQLAANIDQTRDLAILAAEVQRLNEQLQRSKQLPAEQDLPRLVRDLNQLGQQNGLQALRYEPKPSHTGELFDELPVSINFQGEFMSVFRFLQQTEQLPRLTRVRKLSLRSLDGKKGRVDAQLTLNVYSKEGT